MKKILIVDDSNTVLMMEQMVLKRGSYQIILACDGNEAVNKAIAEVPDIILLDIVMPKMDGFEALKLIRADEKTSRIPVIMVTTRGEEQNVEKAFQYGCTDFITKPINATELIAKIRDVLKE